MQKDPVDLGVFIVIRNEEGAYLIVLHNYGEKKISLPGGGLEQGEIVTDGIRREVFEETGFNIEITGLIGIFALQKKRGQVILFEGEIVGGDFRQSNAEIAACGFMTMESLESSPDSIYQGQLNLLHQAEEFVENGRQIIYDHLTHLTPNLSIESENQ